MADYSQYLFKSFAKTTGLGVRLFQNRQPAYYYASTHLLPDPVTPQLAEIFASPHRAGIIITPLYQHYGYAALGDGDLLVLGPTAMLKEDPEQLEALVHLLGVAEKEKPLYLQRLCCSPEVSAEHLAWMLSFFVTAVSGAVFGVENVFIATRTHPFWQDIAETHVLESFEFYENIDLAETVLTSYRFERIANLYVKNGQVDQMADLFEASPRIKAGKMAKDTLRQSKNMLICAATTMSRAAIDGGLDPQSAFKLSDLYIQKCEILRDPAAISGLIREMALDFAARVHALGYGHVQSSKFFEDCMQYIKRNLFSRIMVKDMAEALSMSPNYLSTRFRTVTGKPLGQFILELKINESKQLLRYGDREIADIAMHLGFSSQSHFQNAFKKHVGVTPLAYRRQFG